MTHNPKHEFNIEPVCIGCVNQWCDERDKLLAFVRKVNNGAPENTDPLAWLCDELEDGAEALLKELGFENE